jgi:hypothetical protein
MIQLHMGSYQRQKFFSLAIILCLVAATSCGNKANNRSYYRATSGLNSQDRYAKFRQMSALAMQRRQANSGGLGSMEKMMLLSMESQMKAKQEQEKLAATIAIGGGAATLGIASVGLIATAIANKKARKAEAAALEKRLAADVEIARMKYGSADGEAARTSQVRLTPEQYEHYKKWQAQQRATPKAADKTLATTSAGGGTDGAASVAGRAAGGGGGAAAKTPEQIAEEVIATKCQACKMASASGNCNCSIPELLGLEERGGSSEALIPRITAAAAAVGGGGVSTGSALTEPAVVEPAPVAAISRPARTATRPTPVVVAATTPEAKAKQTADLYVAEAEKALEEKQPNLEEVWQFYLSAERKYREANETALADDAKDQYDTWFQEWNDQEDALVDSE